MVGIRYILINSDTINDQTDRLESTSTKYLRRQKLRNIFIEYYGLLNIQIPQISTYMLKVLKDFCVSQKSELNLLIDGM